MVSFAKATKWLLAGDKIKGKSWDKGYWWRKLGTDIINQDGDIVELNSTDLAATDWVRLVPRKRVDESLYEPVGTVPVVGDRVVPAWAKPGDAPVVVEQVTTHNVIADKTGMARKSFADGNHRVLKRRDVFTDPRVGDVIAYGMSGLDVQITVRGIVPNVGILALDRHGVAFGYTFAEWSTRRDAWTVKHRAPEGGAK